MRDAFYVILLALLSYTVLVVVTVSKDDFAAKTF
jgi:hypothetical protein